MVILYRLHCGPTHWALLRYGEVHDNEYLLPELLCQHPMLLSGIYFNTEHNSH